MKNKQMFCILLFSVVFSVILLLIYNNYNAHYIAQSIRCCSNQSTKETNLNIKYRKQPNKRHKLSIEKYIITFIETNHYRKSIELKQLCAIESAAKHNPNASIRVQSVRAIIDVPEILSTYPNIKVSIIDLNKTFNNTLLSEWWSSQAIYKNKQNYTIFAHLSDALRYLFVYQYGGFYSDLDTITIKSLEPLTKFNGFVYNIDDASSVVANGFFHFEKGHKLLKNVLNKIPKVYKPNLWGTIGPLILRPIVLDFCNITNVDDLLKFGNKIPAVVDEVKKSISLNKTLSNVKNNNSVIYTQNKTENLSCGITLLPFYITYPFVYPQYKSLFAHSAKIDIRQVIHSYSIHFFGLLSNAMAIDGNEYSIYEYFASVNCPIVYNLLIKNKNASLF